MDRASVFGTEGWEFESLQARQFINDLQSFSFVTLLTHSKFYEIIPNIWFFLYRYPSFDTGKVGMLKQACSESGRRAASGIPGFAGAAPQTWGCPFAAFGLTDLPLFVTFALTYAAYALCVKTAAISSTPLRADRTNPSERIGIFEHSLAL